MFLTQRQLGMLALQVFGTIALIVFVLVLLFWGIDHLLQRRERKTSKIRPHHSTWLNDRAADDRIFQTLREFDDELARTGQASGEARGGQLTGDSDRSWGRRNFDDGVAGW